MEPDQSDQSDVEQTSPRGNDWEVVQLTASTYASAPGPRRSEPSEEAEGKEYGAMGNDSAVALLMSGHFSVSPNEVTESKERQKELCSEDAVPDEGDSDQRVPSFDKGKSLPQVDMEVDDDSALKAMSLVGKESIDFSSSPYSPTDAEKEISWSATDDNRSEKKTEETTLEKMNPVTGSSKVVASGEQNEPDGSRIPRDAWWRKQLVSLYKGAKDSNKLWPIFVAAAALMGMAYFRRRWQKGKLQLQQVKLQPSSSKEKIDHAVGPINRIKDILVAGNLPSSTAHGDARLS